MWKAHICLWSCQSLMPIYTWLECQLVTDCLSDTQSLSDIHTHTHTCTQSSFSAEVKQLVLHELGQQHFSKLKVRCAAVSFRGRTVSYNVSAFWGETGLLILGLSFSVWFKSRFTCIDCHTDFKKRWSVLLLQLMWSKRWHYRHNSNLTAKVTLEIYASVFLHVRLHCLLSISLEIFFLRFVASKQNVRQFIFFF